MKKRKISALLLALLLLISLCGCGKTEQKQADEPSQDAEQTAQQGTAQDASYPITFTDMMGQQIELDAPAERIVALTAADCEIIYAIGGGDKLVGRGEYCDYPEEVLSLPSVQSGYETNIEQIIALAPDAVICASMAQSKEQVLALEQAGIKVIESSAADIEGVYTSIDIIGKTVGMQAEADALAESMKQSFAEVIASPEGEKKTVYFEVSPLEWGLWTAGKNTFMNEIAEMIGLRNIFDDVEGWAEISEEQVIERNPDYIVTISMYSGEGPTPTEEILSRSGWEGITAVKNSAVLNLVNDELSRPAPRLVDGARLMHSFVYGE